MIVEEWSTYIVRYTSVHRLIVSNSVMQINSIEFRNAEAQASRSIINTWPQAYFSTLLTKNITVEL